MLYLQLQCWNFKLSVTPFWTSRVLLESTNSGWMFGWVSFFPCSSIWENCFRLVWGTTFSTGLKPGWNGWKTICVIMSRDCPSRYRTISWGYSVSTKNGWKSVLLRNVNLINPNGLWLIPTEHDLRDRLGHATVELTVNPSFCPVGDQNTSSVSRRVLYLSLISAKN